MKLIKKGENERRTNKCSAGIPIWDPFGWDQRHQTRARSLALASVVRWNHSFTSPMASAYRDRTSEFRSLTETLKKIEGVAPPNQADNVPSTSKQSSPIPYSRSEFNRKASRIGLGIHDTTQKISRLDQCKPTSTFFHFCLILLRLKGEGQDTKVWVFIFIYNFLKPVFLENCHFTILGILYLVVY